MAYFIHDLLIAYSIILKLFYTSFHHFTRFDAWKFHYLGTIFSYFGHIDQKWSQFTIKICLSTLAWLFLSAQNKRISYWTTKNKILSPIPRYPLINPLINRRVKLKILSVNSPRDVLLISRCENLKTLSEYPLHDKLLSHKI